jgi:hypothetical protein
MSKSVGGTSSDTLTTFKRVIASEITGNHGHARQDFTSTLEKYDQAEDEDNSQLKEHMKKFCECVEGWVAALRPHATLVMQELLCKHATAFGGKLANEEPSPEKLQDLHLVLNTLKAMQIDSRAGFLLKGSELASEWDAKDKVDSLRVASESTITSHADVKNLALALDGIRHRATAGEAFNPDVVAGLAKVRWYCLKHAVVKIQAASMPMGTIDDCVAAVVDIEKLFSIQGDLMASQKVVELLEMVKSLRAATEPGDFEIEALSTFDKLEGVLNGEVPDFVSSIVRAKCLWDSLVTYWSNSKEEFRRNLSEGCGGYLKQYRTSVERAIADIEGTAFGAKGGKAWHCKYNEAKDDLLEYFEKTLNKFDCASLENRTTVLKEVCNSRRCPPPHVQYLFERGG